MAGADKAQESLLKDSTFGGATDVIFDGFKVRALTANEKKALEKRKDLRKAGSGTVTDVPTLSELVIEADTAAARSESKKSGN